MVGSFARTAHRVVAAAFVACAVVQVVLAGLGVFDDAGAFLTHRDFGYLFGWLTLVILVLALIGRMPRRITGLSVLLLVLFALQSVLVAARTSAPGIAALHPLNGFAVLATGIVTARASWSVRGRPAPGSRYASLDARLDVSPDARRATSSPGGASSPTERTEVTTRA